MKIFKKILLIIVVLFFIYSGITTIVMNINTNQEMLPGITSNMFVFFGILKIIFSLLLLVSKVRILASYILTGYMGGAIMAMLVISKGEISSILFPGIVLLILWIVCALNFKHFHGNNTCQNCDKKHLKDNKV